MKTKTIIYLDNVIEALQKHQTGYEGIAEYEQGIASAIYCLKSTKFRDIDTSDLTDGFHTFDELYEHRHRLFIALMHSQKKLNDVHGIITKPWKSKKHFDGSEMKGWFVAGLKNYDSFMITYHLPIRLWDELNVDEREFAPEWDGHTSQDVLERLKNI